MQGHYKHPAPPRVQIHIAPWAKYTLAFLIIAISTLFTFTLYTLHHRNEKITQLESERITLQRRNEALQASINNISAEHAKLLNQIKALQEQSAHTAQLKHRITELETIIQTLRNSQNPFQESHVANSPSTTTLNP
jgi:peptidoglycan hydrolase CwlO-like protein